MFAALSPLKSGYWFATVSSAFSPDKVLTGTLQSVWGIREPNLTCDLSMRESFFLQLGSDRELGKCFTILSSDCVAGHRSRPRSFLVTQHLGLGRPPYRRIRFPPLDQWFAGHIAGR